MGNKIDHRDREILRLLNKNSREPDSAIARRLKISKQAVSYRIRKMQENGIIKNFYTEFNLSRLGYNSYYIFLELEKITNRTEQEIITEIIREANIGWVINGVGKSNIILLVYARTLGEFEESYIRIKNICSQYLRDANFAILTKSQKLSYRFLDVDFESMQAEKLQETNLDDFDIKLMREIAHDAREKVVDIARNAKISSDIVRYRLKKLQNSGIINGFRTKLDISRLGFQWYLLLFRLQPINDSIRKKLIGYLINQKETYYLTSTIGNYDLMVDLHVASSADVRDFIFRLRDKFPEAIKNFESLLIFREYKLSYLPKLE